MQERDSGCWRKYAPLDYAMRRFNSGHRIEDHYVDVTEMIEIGNYYPDFLVKLSAKRIFIVETKGREDLDVPLKMQRLRQWCEDINRVQSDVVYDFVYVDQESFEKYKPASFRQLVDGFREYKEKNVSREPGSFLPPAPLRRTSRRQECLRGRGRIPP